MARLRTRDADSREAAELEARTLFSLRGVGYLGGYVPEAAITPGGLYDVLFLEDRLVVFAHRQAKVLAEVPYSKVEDVEIGGPGLVNTGGGFGGGGFGVRGTPNSCAADRAGRAGTARAWTSSTTSRPAPSPTPGSASTSSSWRHSAILPRG